MVYPHFKLNATMILHSPPHSLLFPLQLYLLTVTLFLLGPPNHKELLHTLTIGFLKVRWQWSHWVSWSIVRKQRNWALSGLIKPMHCDVHPCSFLHWEEGDLRIYSAECLQGLVVQLMGKREWSCPYSSIAAMLHDLSIGLYLTFNLGAWEPRYKTLLW